MAWWLDDLISMERGWKRMEMAWAFSYYQSYFIHPCFLICTQPPLYSN